ncbi:hypothetical protein [Stenotrophomonas tuberculopleuritidis]|uniref:hypothetical protein n=1 Tax=Stenotrophomonas tuberculopleuritidis TaxID=3055079 RepID=UPI0026E57555|nr:hypothetical protein [Stenotrophomonas sp. 704A1]
MKTRKFALVGLGLLAAAACSAAGKPGVDYVSKVFRDGAYLPHAYSEHEVLRRYGEGDRVVDASGLIRRRYRDPTTQLEVIVTSNPDVEPKFRTIDEIRVSSITADRPSSARVEGLKSLRLKGVAIGDPASKALSAARGYGSMDAARAKLGSFDVERVCGFAEGGSNICFFTRDEKVVSMAVGFGP